MLALGLVLLSAVLGGWQAHARRAGRTAPLDALLRDLYDPASPRYHRFLTPDQFMAAFGPTEEDHSAVVAFARAHGLVVAASQPDRRLVDVTGNSGDMVYVQVVIG